MPNDRRFYWTPLVVGLAYLAAATAGGRRGGHWATACVLVAWGVAVVFAGAARPDLDIAGLYMVGAGLGAVGGLLTVVALANLALGARDWGADPHEGPA